MPPDDDVPLDQEVQIDVSKEPEVQVETKAPEEKKQESKSLQERLREQIRAEVIAEEATKNNARVAEQNKALEDARRQAQTHAEALQAEQARRQQADLDSLTNVLGAAQSERDIAKRDYIAARNAGDVDAEADALARMQQATSRIERFEDAKSDYEARLEHERANPPQRHQVQPPSLESRIAQLPAPAQEWFRKHPEYATDPQKNSVVNNLHNLAVKAGHEVLSPSYFEYVETRLGMRDPGQQRQERVSTMAPVSRDAPSTGGSTSPTTVKLSTEEREMAWTTRPDQNMTRAQAETLYARNKLKLIQAKSTGSVQ